MQLNGDKQKTNKRKWKEIEEEEAIEPPPAKRRKIDLTRPTRPKLRNKDVNRKAHGSLKQPVTVLDPKDPTPYTLPLDWETVVDQFQHDDPEAPKKVEVENLRQFTGVKIKEMGVELTGGNQGGLYPAVSSMVTKLPESSDYRRSRPQQILSQLSEVMRYRAEEAGQTPVEVQFGYGKKEGGGLDLFTSTNNQESQEWLLKALKSPVEHLKHAAKSKNPDVSRVALKLLFLKEQNEERRQQIEDDPNAKELGEELELTEEIRELFLSGPVNVVFNKAKRHAEQNIGDVLHERGYDTADIQGTMIRCEGCSSELGINLEDQKGKGVVGRGYASQAATPRHQHTLDEVRRGRARVATNRSRRSRSTSPPRLPPLKMEEEKEEKS